MTTPSLDQQILDRLDADHAGQIAAPGAFAALRAVLDLCDDDHPTTEVQFLTELLRLAIACALGVIDVDQAKELGKAAVRAAGVDPETWT